ncbi:nucleoside-diphosphate-sugar epimerase [Catalinimonas alkaloidigena]|uniref:NAD(P)-dependent oxidoreductase n=1 Tax=Catalinimonas alkaloidigena TaxID=1075417 RepID=UPI0024055E9C|nr:NAD(P)-binding oxidoreductase [Catalinimonas alkaloidigena]MDF9799396.1 nucleoside-diphosphate-sugar epimerase [Catalinimonas alkaloidigena]
MNKDTTLVVGASGSTGKHLVTQLLNKGEQVKVIVRSPEKLPDAWKNNSQISIIEASILDVSEQDRVNYVKDCHAVASCLGHSPTLKGIYGKPKKLVTDAVSLLCHAIQMNSPKAPVKFVLMNTAGNRNRDLDEPISFWQRLVIGLLRILLPPHQDNEKAADYLSVEVGQKDSSVEWVVVRPDSLIDNDKVTKYELYASPTRSAIFDPGKTSRINVGHFMASLITDDNIWKQWKGKMPVIYNEIA